MVLAVVVQQSRFQPRNGSMWNDSNLLYVQVTGCATRV